jgi:hypothetical protein
MMNQKNTRWIDALGAMFVGGCMAATAMAQSDESTGSAPQPPKLDEPSLLPNVPVPPVPPDLEDEDDGPSIQVVIGGLDKGMSAILNEASSAIKEAVGAEVLSGDAFDEDVMDPSDSLPKKLLGENTPEWVKKGLVAGDEYRFAISSSLFTDLDQCRDDLRNRMLSEVQAYLDKNVLKTPISSSLEDLTLEYVEKFWLNQKQEFDNVQTRENVVYHQLWVGLQISAEQLKKVREWESASVREKRTKQAGVLGGVGIAAITLLSGLVGVLAKREKAKLK